MKEHSLFGSTFETSLRILILLEELSELLLDEQQICCIDFMSIYGADFDLLDANLHGNGLFRFSEFSAKSTLVAYAIKKLVLNSFIKFVPTDSGYSYSISSVGKKIVSKISDGYVTEYRIAVREVYRTFPDLQTSKMQQKIYDMTINSLEAANE